MKSFGLEKNNLLLKSTVEYFSENCVERIEFIKRNKFIFSEISIFLNSCLSLPKKIVFYCCGNSIITESINCEEIDIFEVNDLYLKKLIEETQTHSFNDKISKYTEYDHIIIADIEYQENPSYNLDKISSSMSEDARIIVISKSLIWFFIIKVLRILLNNKIPKKNFLPMHYLENLYDSCNLEIIRNEKINFFPFQIPIVTFILNKIFRLPIFNFFCINNITILKKKTIKRETNYNVSVIIPCKNEEENIEEIGKQLINLGKRTQYLFGNDLSTDNTKSEIIKIMNKNDNNNINIVHYESSGICKSENVYKGIDNAEGDIILIYDADNTVSLVDINFCINLLIKGNSDIINCTRMIYPQHKEAMKRINFFGNIIFAYLFSVLFKKKITDTLCGTKIFYKKDWSKIKKDISLWGAKDLWGDFDILIGAYKNNLKITEVPVIYHERIAGKTKMTSVFKNGLRMLWIVFYSFYKIRIKY
jgi:hypothetical protein